MKFSLECECAWKQFDLEILTYHANAGPSLQADHFGDALKSLGRRQLTEPFAMVNPADPKTQSSSFDVLWQSGWENSSTHGFIPLARGAKLFVSKGARDEVRRLTIFLGPASLPFFKGGGIRLLHRCFGSIWPIQDAFQGKYSLYGSDKNIPRSPCTAFPLL